MLSLLGCAELRPGYHPQAKILEADPVEKRHLTFPPSLGSCMFFSQEELALLCQDLTVPKKAITLPQMKWVTCSSKVPQRVHLRSVRPLKASEEAKTS